MPLTVSCRLPCVTSEAEELPGVIPDFGIVQDETADTNIVPLAGNTSGTIGEWSELMPADAARLGASVQNREISGSLFILPFATGLPDDGLYGGEVEVPQAPGYFSFPYVPNQRYVVRGDVASMAYSLNTW